MTSQDDVGMVWYGVSGMPFNPTDPSDVMLNTATAGPLLSDQPRSLLAPEGSLAYPEHHHASIVYGDQTMAAQNTMIYGSNTGDYVNQAEYMYESYDGYDEDSCGTNNMGVAVPNSMHAQDSPSFNSEDDGCMPAKTKKPKVHQHPSLKLKTPIAYQKDTDIDAIPIMKEGMAVCERCGAIGVKHAFYGKERKFCSLVCARGGNNNIQALHKETSDEAQPQIEEEFSQVMNPELVRPDFVPSMQYPQQVVCKPEPTNVKKLIEASGSASPEMSQLRITPSHLPQIQSTESSAGFDWSSAYFESEYFVAAPVHFFKHSPMSECLEPIGPCMKVEVSCREDSTIENAFWVATVINICGYNAKLRYEGFVDDSSRDFWIDLCSKDVHPVGWCATQGQALIPPKSIQDKVSDWKDFLKKRLMGARTLPTNFQTRVVESQKSRFRPGLNLEVVDKNRIAQMRVATVTAVIGKRIHLRYHGASSNDNGFWCHEDSPIIHPVGWSREVGHEIVASQSYHEKCMQVSYEANDATPELFLSPSIMDINTRLQFVEGMKIEAIDPLNLATICVATIMKVLQHNYLLIRIDSYETDNTGSDWFCYHATSPYIFPAGFCNSGHLPLTPPKGYQGDFVWETYVTDTQSIMAPSHLFKRNYVNHDFKVGMYLEAADLMDPRLVCVANVKEVNGRLLRIHFDGWQNEFDQWVDSQSCDIYPVGWCAHVGYRLEGPRQDDYPDTLPRKKLKGRGGRKSRLSNAKRTGVSRGVENDSPEPGTVSSNDVDRRLKRTRNTQKNIHHTLQAQHSVVESSIERLAENPQKIPSLHDVRGRARKTPLGTSNQTVRGSRRPIRSTRTSLSYNNSDEEDVSDETSSGVASLGGSEASRDCWDEDPLTPAPSQYINGSNQPTNTIPDNALYTDINGQQDLMANISTPADISEYQVTSTEFSELEHPLDDLSSILPQDTIVTDDLVVCSTTAAAGYAQTSVNLYTHSDFQMTTEMPVEPYIPRIVDNVTDVKASEILPKFWSSVHVATFLRRNDLGAYGENFIADNINGAKFLTLNQNDIVNLNRMKLGPSVRVHALIQQLIAIINPAQARYQATLNRGLSR